MQAFRDILYQWNELWRYPDLLVTLEQTNAQRPNPEIFAKELIAGLASPQSPRECLLSLLRSGEFQSAERVLETASFGAASSPDDHEALLQELDRARRDAEEEVRARTATLQARASSVGLLGQAPAGVDEVIERRITESQSLLDGWEDQIRKKEAEFEEELQRRLNEATVAIDGKKTPGTAAWKKSVERCLEAREYEAARFLMESGPAAKVPDEPDEPLFIPRRPPWPWDEPLGEVLQWFQDTQPSPREFHAGWRHDSNDRPAARLLNALQKVEDSGVADFESAREFADALDGFLGCEEMEREVAARGNWFETTLRGLDDPRLPCFALDDSVGVRLWIPGARDAGPLDGLEDDALGLCFLPDQDVQYPDGVVGFDSWTLLRMFADREHRGLNFLRDIGSKTDLETLVPTDVSGVRLPPMDPGATRGYTAWVLDRSSP